MSNAVCQTTLAFHSHTQITARFDGGNLTSDAGWLLFGSLDRQDRLCEDFSSCIADSRDQRYVRHEQLKLIRQRVFQIVAGYEDCNDADTLHILAIRKRMKLSRQKFADRFGLDARAVQEWEQGRRVPDRAARILLTVIDRDPDAVVRALSE